MWAVKVVFLILIFFASWAMADEVKESDQVQTEDPISNIKTSPQDAVKVVFDITRGVKKARIIKNGQVVSEHKISGAKNAPIQVTIKGKVHNFCAFTTTGLNIKPTHAHRSYRSREHKANLANFVTFDFDRLIGAHQGEVGGYSAGCIRQGKKDAKAVYDLVVANSEFIPGSPTIKSTNVTFDVIDNTPGRYEAECKCLKSHMGDTTSDRAKKVCALAGRTNKASATEAEVNTAPAKGAVVRPRKRPEAKPTVEETTVRPKKRPAAKPAKTTKKPLLEAPDFSGIY